MENIYEFLEFLKKRKENKNSEKGISTIDNQDSYNPIRYRYDEIDNDEIDNDEIDNDEIDNYTSDKPINKEKDIEKLSSTDFYSSEKHFPYNFKNHQWIESKFDYMKRIIEHINKVDIRSNGEYNKYIDILRGIEYSFCNIELRRNKVLTPDYIENIWEYIPMYMNPYIKILMFLDKYNLKNYNFHEFGCGVGIKTFIAKKYGYNSMGFEISDNMVYAAEKIGLGDIVKKRDILTIKPNELISPKIIYDFQPIKNDNDMRIYEKHLAENILNKNDILIRVNDFGISQGGPLTNKKDYFEEDTGMKKLVYDKKLKESDYNPSDYVYIKK